MTDAIFEMIQRCPALECIESPLREAAKRLIACYEAGGKVLICGNGGSASDSEHIAGELLKGFLRKRPLNAQDRAALGAELADNLQYGLAAVPLVSHGAIMTAVINDLGGETVFAQQVMGLGAPGDVLIGLSTSGNAADVVNAMRVAKLRSMTCIALTGSRESAMSEIADVTIAVPSVSTPVVQEYHLPVYHALCAQVEAHFFSE